MQLLLALLAVIAECCPASALPASSSQHQPPGQAAMAAPAVTPGRALSSEPIDDLLRAAAGLGFSGVALIARGDEVLLRKGIGSADDEAGLRATPETVFNLGSITKQFTAAGIMLLEQQGRLRTDARVGDYVPGLPADKAALIIHQLLTHTSGLADAHGDDDEPVARAEALRRIAQQELKFPPGTGFTYSNSGYTLLAAVIENVSGRPYEQFVREALLQPAGMTMTGPANDPRFASAPAFHGYWNGKDMGKVTAFAGPFWTTVGNGEWMSTLDDLLRWSRFLESGKVIGRNQVARMRSRFVSRPNGAFWGYAMQNHPLALKDGYGHGGVGNGGNAEFYYFPSSDLTLILYSNRITYREMKNPDGNRVVLPARALRDLIVRLLADQVKAPAQQTAR